MNYSYNYNLRLIPKNNSINNFDPKALKKAKKNILNIPMNNGGPIRLKNKDINNNSINRILKKPKTPDLDNNINHQYQQYNFKNNYYPRQSHNNFDNKLINNNIINGNDNAKYNRPSTAPLKDKNIKNKKNYSYDKRKNNINKYNNNIGGNNQLYNLYNSKRLPSPMLKSKKEMSMNKKVRYRAPSPIISPSLGISNFQRKKKMRNDMYEYT